MRACGVNQNENGAILIIVLIFLFVLTVMLVSNCEDVIVSQKMQHAIAHHDLVLLRAEAGMQQVILSLEGESVVLPDSAISLETSIKNIKTDACGNQTVEILSVAQDGNDKVVLNSRDIFARVPVEKDCSAIPLHRCVWWKERKA